MTLDLCQIPGAFHLPQPNWDVIREWVTDHVPDQERHQAWTDIAGQWLGVLDNALGNQYETAQSEHVLFFGPRGYEHTEALLAFAESGLATIADAIGSMAGEGWLGPLVILLFADAATYIAYASTGTPERALDWSAGQCRKSGYVHIALRPGLGGNMQRVMMHEMTHACLSHLTLPLWLEEGITQLAEETGVPGWSRFVLDGKTATAVRRFWQEHGLSAFWWGTGFSLHDEGRNHSYTLANVLFRLISTDQKRQLPNFLRYAHADDAGESAARKHLGMGLAELATKFLGQGTCDAVPTDCASYCRRGVLYLSRSQFEGAIADFAEAIRIDPRYPDVYVHRGNALYQMGRYAAAIADLEVATKENSSNFYALNNLAWILATCPDEKLRDGARALECANAAYQVSGETPWYCLGTLAAAYAEAGDFEEARKWARESMRLAPESERLGCRERLKLYKEDRPYREPTKRPIGTSKE